MKNVQKLDEEQKAALLDLLILAMYSDQHLASTEDDRVKRLVDSFGLESEYQRGQVVDASVARMRTLDRGESGVRSCVYALARKFETAEARATCIEVLNDLLTSDGKLSEDERLVLEQVRHAIFQ